MRKINYFLPAFLAIFFVNIIFAHAGPLGTTGKILGTVTDSKDNSLMPGAIISIEGTTIKAGSDENGQYAILNVPVGTYSVKCTYVGYKPEVQNNVLVSADVTTTVNFSMAIGDITVGEIEILENRIKKFVPGEDKIILREEDWTNANIRGIDNIVAKNSSVVQDEKGNVINIRGGRPGETLVIIDGVPTNNPLDRTSTSNVSNGALQEIALLMGGFSSEYGNVLSGVINVTTKTGTDKYTASLELISDFIAGDWINTASQGYNVYNVTFGGPVIPTKLLSKYWNIYGSYERTFKLVDQPVSQDVAELWSPDGILPNFSRESHSYTGKTQVNFSEITNGKVNLTLIGGYSGSIENKRTWIGSFGKFNSYHNPRTKNSNRQVYGKISHSLGARTFYDIQGSYFTSEGISGDGVFFQDEFFQGKDGYMYPSLMAYGDPSTVPGLIIPGTILSSNVHHRVFRGTGTVYNSTAFVYKDKIESFSANLNFTHQLLTKKFGSHEIKLGGSYNQYKVRHWEAAPVGFAALDNPDKYTLAQGNVIHSPVIDEGGANQNFLLAYGYDPLGNLTESDYIVNGLNVTEGPKKPRIGAFYFLDKMEFRYFNTNIGFRLDYLDPNTEVPLDYRDMKGADGVMTDADFTNVEKTIEVSPRLGFSFPITDKTVFHAQYGKFIQLPALEELYSNRRILRDLADGGVGYFSVFQNPLLKPEKTTAYELGLQHTAGDYLTFTLTAYYKETSDLIQAVNIQAYDKSYSFAIYNNGDFGVIRGFDFGLDMRRYNRLRASVSYSLSFASGTGSDINSLSTIAYNSDDPPKIPSALDFDQRHTGSLELDYRWGDKETDKLPNGFFGSILSRLGFNVLFSFNSGRPYTPSRNDADPLSVASTTSTNVPVAPLNSEYSPWNYRLDLKIDKTVRFFDKMDVTLYLQAINVLNQQLVNDVYATSGEPGYTGWLDSYQGKLWAQQNGQEAVDYYNIRSHSIGNYGPPRQLRAGLRIFFN